MLFAGIEQLAFEMLDASFESAFDRKDKREMSNENKQKAIILFILYIVEIKEVYCDAILMWLKAIIKIELLYIYTPRDQLQQNCNNR
jgi:hypothetical protein